jgi:tetratricopeptide (TPR) repeat protein
MKSLKLFLGLIIFIGAISIYIGGCSPAETTTGKLAYNQKDWEKAATELAKGLAVDKTDEEAWYMLGYAQTELGKFEEATNSFKQARILSPNHNNAMLIYYADKFNAGINDFNNGVSAYKKKDSLGSKNNFKKAVISFKGATSIMPDSISAFQLLADTYNNLGETDKALNIYQNILDKSKSADDASNIAKLLFSSARNEIIRTAKMIETLSTIDANDEKLKEKRESVRKEIITKFENTITVFNTIKDIKYLKKDNEYVLKSLFNLGLCNYQIALLLTTKSEYLPYINNSIKYLLKRIKWQCKS